MMRLKKASRTSADGLRVSEIASDIGLTVPAITQILTILEKEGFVRRAMDPDDRRGVRVFLTPRGDSMLEPALLAYEASFISLIDYLGDKDSHKLYELLSSVERFYLERGGPSDLTACDHETPLQAGEMKDGQSENRGTII
jgi:DNA-binding MarR family transcriptional regulator